MSLHIVSFLFCGLLLATACTSPNDAVEPSLAPPATRKLGEGEAAKGSINGQAWTFKSGRAYMFDTNNANYMVVQLWGDYFSDPCKEKTGSVLQARLTAPLLASGWNIAPDDPFNANISIFFTDLNFTLQPRDNMRADRGEVAFTMINPKEVTGYVAGSFRAPKVGGTSIAGDFAVPICPSYAPFGDNF